MVTARGSASRIVSTLLANPEVRSVWVGGSVRDGTDDEVSDLDLWLVADNWSADAAPGLFVAGTSVTIGDAPLFHGVDMEGVIVDVRYGPTPPPEYAPFEVSLRPAEAKSPRISLLEPAGLFSNFWINSYKHRKPLWRGLDALCVIGLHFDRLALIQAWVEHDSGQQASGFSIHGMTPVVRDHIGPEPRQLLGLPARDLRELISAIRAYRAEMARMTPPGSALMNLVQTDPVFFALCEREGL